MTEYVSQGMNHDHHEVARGSSTLANMEEDEVFEDETVMTNQDNSPDYLDMNVGTKVK